MEDADDVADVIMARLGPPVTPATPKEEAVTDAIVAPSKAGDPSTARGIHYSGMPGQWCRRGPGFCQNGQCDETIRPRAFLWVRLPLQSLTLMDQNLILRTN